MTAPAPLKGVHHVAYRCKDAKETVEFYRDALGMDFQLAIAEDKVPSTGAHDPYMHVFLDAGNGNVLAFLNCPPSRTWTVTGTRRNGCSISPSVSAPWMS